MDTRRLGPGHLAGLGLDTRGLCLRFEQACIGGMAARRAASSAALVLLFGTLVALCAPLLARAASAPRWAALQLRGGKENGAVSGKAAASAKRSSKRGSAARRDDGVDADSGLVDLVEDELYGTTGTEQARDRAATAGLANAVADPLSAGEDVNPPAHVLALRHAEQGVRRRAGRQAAGSGWKTVKGKRKRVAGIDWDTWQRKRNVNTSALEASVVAPYEGRGPMLYQDVFGFSGKQVHRRVLRSSWEKMSLEEIADKTKRDAAAIFEAAMLDAEAHQEYVGTTAVAGSARERPEGQTGQWEKELFPQVKGFVDAEAQGQYFTGRMETVEKNGRVYQMPAFSNDTTRANAVTGERERIPGAAQAARSLSIAEHERVFRYSSSSVGAGGAGVGQGEEVEGGKERQVLQDAVEEERRVVQQVVERAAGQRGVSVGEYVTLLKAGKVKLSKHRRLLKHVKGFSVENLDRFVNGTLVYNSAWGPTRVIRGREGTDTGVSGAVWSGVVDPRAGAGRKRRDAAWFRARAVAGHDKAQLQMGLCYAMGQGVRRDLAKAAGWFARAARQGNPQALTELAMCYRYGEGVLPSNATARRLLAAAAARGASAAQEELGIALLEGGLGQAPNASAAVRLLREAAAQGSTRAMTRLGLAFADGRAGVRQDDDKAEFFLAQAAAAYKSRHRSSTAVARRQTQGARAMLKLAHRFRSGRGVRKDTTKAVEWYAKAALRGLPRAHLALGLCYLSGEGVPRDDVIGARQVERAAKLGCRAAVFNYALLLLQGRGLVRDAVRARQWFLTGAMNGDAQCMVNAGACLAQGVGGECDDRQARRWFTAASQEPAYAGEAYYNLAILARQGRGGAEGGEGADAAQRMTETMRYLRLAAAANSSEAVRIVWERRRAAERSRNERSAWLVSCPAARLESIAACSRSALR